MSNEIYLIVGVGVAGLSIPLYLIAAAILDLANAVRSCADDDDGDESEACKRGEA